MVGNVTTAISDLVKRVEPLYSQDGDGSSSRVLSPFLEQEVTPKGFFQRGSELFAKRAARAHNGLDNPYFLDETDATRLAIDQPEDLFHAARNTLRALRLGARCKVEQLEPEQTGYVLSNILGPWRLAQDHPGEIHEKLVSTNSKIDGLNHSGKGFLTTKQRQELPKQIAELMMDAAKLMRNMHIVTRHKALVSEDVGDIGTHLVRPFLRSRRSLLNIARAVDSDLIVQHKLLQRDIRLLHQIHGKPTPKPQPLPALTSSRKELMKRWGLEDAITVSRLMAGVLSRRS